MTRCRFAFTAGAAMFGDVSAISQRKAAVPVPETMRDHNPLLFDCVLKRPRHAGHRRFAASIFETRRFFERKPA